MYYVKTVKNLDAFEKQKISNSIINSIGEEINDFLSTVQLEIKKSETQCKNNIYHHIDTYFRILEKKDNPN